MMTRISQMSTRSRPDDMDIMGQLKVKTDRKVS